ncbi:HNH endonuclease signature motif containing protein [Clostridium tertium]|uniref:HNH endonuclease n=3 Tax=Clostridium tertium TaxID=1559 RepID=UPI00232C2E0E|nr:HNH endonuclease signature motif containing protein [Clostridium tertium]MDB1927190.1 HNH endonuclease signature motif containing protein [Clostridium tertium]MDB1930967.1 HNH endonuclease signature motif containing protein [Clostridium tertium]
MTLMLLIPIIIMLSILFTILLVKNENKKDKQLLERKKEKIIYNDFIDSYKKESKKLEYQEYLNSPHWKETRLKALKRAGNRCQLCSSTNNLNVHHNTYKNKGNEDLKDLVVLCRDCHAKFHDKLY